MAQVTRWSQPDRPEERQLRRLMEDEGLSPYSWSNGPGDVYPVHSHTYNKVIYVARGSITFTLPDTNENIELQEGDRLDLPHHVAHGAFVGPQGVVCLEAHC